MICTEQGRHPEANPAAQLGGIFLRSDLEINPNLLERIGRAGEIDASTQQARKEMEQFYQEFDPDTLASMLQRKLTHYGKVTAEDLQALEHQHVLEDQAGGFADLVSAVSRTSDHLAERLAALLPQGIVTVGTGRYQIKEGAWNRIWVSLIDPETHEHKVFGRYDDIKERGFYGASIPDRMRLILDVHSEQRRAGLQDKLPFPPAERAVLTVNPHAASVDKFPYLAHTIGADSSRFFDAHKELMPSGLAVVADVGWSDAEGLTSVPDDARAGVDAIRVAINAKAHIEAESLRISDKGEHFSGPGDFNWQVIRERGSQRTVSGFRIWGALVEPLPTEHYDRVTRQRTGLTLPTIEDVKSTWDMISQVIKSDEFKQRAKYLQDNFNARGKESVARRQQRVLATLGRLHLSKELGVSDALQEEKNLQSMSFDKGWVAHQTILSSIVGESAEQLLLDFPPKDRPIPAWRPAHSSMQV